jgi:uncharacterized protein YyaL (SSP411 family)
MRYVDTGREALAHARRRLADAEGRVFASVEADPEYYAFAERTDEMPAVDRRRFADASAAATSAAWYGLAVTGDPPALQSHFRASAPDGAIPHCLDEAAGPRVLGFLHDQALGIESTLMEYRLTGDPALIGWADRAAKWSVCHLWDGEAGAFRMAPARADGTPDLAPIFPLLANGEMATALVSLDAQAGREEYRRYAERVVLTLGPQALASPAGPAVALAAQALSGKPAEAEVAGDRFDPQACALAQAAVAVFGPATVIRWKAESTASITLCVGDRCLPPSRSPRDFLRSVVDSGLAPGVILDPRSRADRTSQQEAS